MPLQRSTSISTGPIASIPCHRDRGRFEITAFPAKNQRSGDGKGSDEEASNTEEEEGGVEPKDGGEEAAKTRGQWVGMEDLGRRRHGDRRTRSGDGERKLGVV